jgi:hypothetical protein
MAKHCQISVRIIVEEMGLDKNAVHRMLTDHAHATNLYKTSAGKFVCEAKSELIGNLSGFAGKARN